MFVAYSAFPYTGVISHLSGRLHDIHQVLAKALTESAFFEGSPTGPVMTLLFH